MSKRVMVMVMFVVGLALGQDKPATPALVPTEAQHMKLENFQLKARLALVSAQEAARAYQQAMGALQGECEAVRKENKWVEGATCNPETLAFAAPAPEAKVKPEEKK